MVFDIAKMSVKITLKAYLKILLHCHKYPYRAINGVLIGKAKQKVALDCIPLFHQSLQLSPMIEIALLQVLNYNAISCIYMRICSSTVLGMKLICHLAALLLYHRYYLYMQE